MLVEVLGMLEEALVTLVEALAMLVETLVTLEEALVTLEEALVTWEEAQALKLTPPALAQALVTTTAKVAIAATTPCRLPVHSSPAPLTTPSGHLRRSPGAPTLSRSSVETTPGSSTSRLTSYMSAISEDCLAPLSACRLSPILITRRSGSASRRSV